MIRIVAVLLALSFHGVPAARGQEVSAERQIEEALFAAPQSLRSGAEVLGIGGTRREGDALTTLRAGTNGLICLADDPAEEGFQVSCYHESLEPYMRLGRLARAQGLDRSAVMDARYEALDKGDFVMPPHAALYSVRAPEAPPSGEAGTAGRLNRLTVVYLPGATLEGTGLPGRPADGIPWLMLPDTPWAHIMISH